MARNRKEPEGPPGLAPWMATFSDLMNLLFCFFVLLFSMSSVDAEKFQQLANSFNATVSVLPHGASAVGDGILVSNGVSQLDEMSEYFSQMGVSEGEEEDKTLEELEEKLEEEKLGKAEEFAEKIEEVLEENNMDSDVEINFTSQYVELVLNGSLLFESGTDDIKQESKILLSKVGDILLRYEDCLIEIIGHTDNVPVPKYLEYSSNLELSCARAIAVAEYLNKQNGISMTAMKPSGRGEYEPVASNETSEGRAQNRRVEIKIHFDLD